MEELWKDIEGYEGYYQISNKGRVMAMPRVIKTKSGITRNCSGRELAKNKTDVGYYYVSLSKNRIRKNHRINRLVAIHFIPNPYNKPEVNHIDGNKANNNVENLEWVTGQENKYHAVYTGLRKPTYGMKPVRCITNGKIYPSVSEAGRRLNVDDSTISKVCRGIVKQTKGFRFEYIA